MTEIPNARLELLEFRVWILSVICLLVLVIFSIMGPTVIYMFNPVCLGCSWVMVRLGTGHFSGGIHTCLGSNKCLEFLFNHPMVVTGLD